MSIHTKSIARSYTLARQSVTPGEIEPDRKIEPGVTFDPLEAFEAGGLISHSNRDLRSRVRSTSRELLQSTTEPPLFLENVSLKALRWIRKMRDREMDAPAEAPPRRQQPQSSTHEETTMSATDHLEIGTISFQRCDGEMVLSSVERARLILSAVAAYEPDLLVTAGHAVDSLDDLNRLAEIHSEQDTYTTIVTEVLIDGIDSDLESHAMWAISADGGLHRFGQQQFATREEADDITRDSIAKFERALPHRSLALPDWNVFALICGEINIVEGRVDPRYVSAAAEEAIMAADVVINPTHDRMGNAGTLDAKRKLLSRQADDERNRVYVSCSNWEVCGDAKGRTQNVTETLHTVYAAGEKIAGEEFADGAFGFVYRHWTLDL